MFFVVITFEMLKDFKILRLRGLSLANASNPGPV